MAKMGWRIRNGVAVAAGVAFASMACSISSTGNSELGTASDPNTPDASGSTSPPSTGAPLTPYSAEAGKNEAASSGVDSDQDGIPDDLEAKYADEYMPF